LSATKGSTNRTNDANPGGNNKQLKKERRTLYEAEKKTAFKWITRSIKRTGVGQVQALIMLWGQRKRETTSDEQYQKNEETSASLNQNGKLAKKA